MNFKFNSIILLSLIVVFGFLVRLYKIDNPIADWHSWRQADTASVTRIYVEEGINLFYPKYHDLSFLQTGIDNPEGYRFVEFPLYNVIHAVLVKLFPFITLEMWGRLLSVFCSLVSIVLLYLIGTRFFGKTVGLLSAFFFAFMPFNVYFSRVVLPEPMSVMFGLGSILFFVKWIDRAVFKHLAISAVLFALSLLVKPHSFFLVAVPALWLAIGKYGLAKLIANKNLWAFAAITLLPLFSWRFWIQRFPEGIPHYQWMFNADGLRFRPAFWRWLFGDRLGRLMLGEWGLIIFASGLIAKTRPKENYFHIAMGLGAFLYVAVIAAANVRHDYYQTIVIPAVCLILGKGVVTLWESDYFSKVAARFITLFSLVMMFGFSLYNVREFYKINHPEIIEAGIIVDQVAPKGAKVLAPYNGDTALLYQTKRSGWPYLTYAIEEMIAKGAQYYVSVNPKSPETQDAFRKFIVIEANEKFIILKLEPKPVQP